MQFIKTNQMSAGKRPPNRIDTDETPAPSGAAKGKFQFLDGNTIKLSLDNGETAVLFVSKGYTYSEVKPVADTLHSILGSSMVGQQTILGLGDGDEGDVEETEEVAAPAATGVGPLDGPLIP